MSKTWKIFVSALAVLIITAHCVAYSYNKLGIDQLIPCVLGYFSIWVIFMAIEEKENNPEPEVRPTSKEVLICNSCKEFWFSPKERCECGSTTLTSTHPSNASFVKQHKIKQYESA